MFSSWCRMYTIIAVPEFASHLCRTEPPTSRWIACPRDGTGQGGALTTLRRGWSTLPWAIIVRWCARSAAERPLHLPVSSIHHLDLTMRVLGAEQARTIREAPLRLKEAMCPEHSRDVLNKNPSRLAHDRSFWSQACDECS